MSELTSRSRRLLDAARAGEPPLDEKKAQVLAGLKATLAAGTLVVGAAKGAQVLASSSPTLAAKLAALSVAAKVGVTVAVVAVVGGGAAAVALRSSAAQPPSAARAAVV